MPKPTASCKSQAGFTLLEIMIALTIMTVAFASILTSQSGAIAQSIKTKETNLAGWLAHRAMVESEHLLEGKPFKELKKIESKKFDAPFERYAWKREIKELKFPEISVPQKEGQPIPEALTLLTRSITKYLDNSVREMVVTVTWQRGDGEQSLTLSTYLIDLDAEFTVGGGG